MFATVLLALTFAAFAISIQIQIDRKQRKLTRLNEKARRLRFIHDDSQVEPPDLAPGSYHTFLSHVSETPLCTA